MTYFTNIPGASDAPSTSQGQMQTNFNTLYSVFAVDHVTFGTGSSSGEHEQITFAGNNVPSSPTEPTSYLYTNAVSSVSQLFFLNSSGTTQQLTGLVSDSTTGTTSDGGVYTVFATPWGFRMFCGKTVSASGSRNLTMSASTFGSTIYTAQATITSATATGSSFTPSSGTNGFNIQSTNNCALYWFAITN